MDVQVTVLLLFVKQVDEAGYCELVSNMCSLMPFSLTTMFSPRLLNSLPLFPPLLAPPHQLPQHDNRGVNDTYR